MLVMDCRLAILPNKLIKSQATISKFFLRGGNPPQTPPANLPILFNGIDTICTYKGSITHRGLPHST